MFNIFRSTTLRDKDNIDITHTKGNGMTINSSTGLITWVPTNNQIRDYEFEVKVSDGELSITQNFIVIVSL